MEQSNNTLIIPAQIEQLPPVIIDRLNKDQKKHLIFGKKIFKVIGTPRVQTFNIGSLGKGHSVTTGAARSVSDNWSIFSGLTSVNMATLNRFRTDIQLRLEDEETHEKIFFEKSFPVEMTLSIEAGDAFSIFHVRAKAENLHAEDGKFLNWTPFIAQDEETKQLIPIGPVPLVIIPESERVEKPSKFGKWASKHPWIVTLTIVCFLVLIIAGHFLFDKGN